MTVKKMVARGVCLAGVDAFQQEDRIIGGSCETIEPKRAPCSFFHVSGNLGSKSRETPPCWVGGTYDLATVASNTVFDI